MNVPFSGREAAGSKTGLAGRTGAFAAPRAMIAAATLALGVPALGVLTAAPAHTQTAAPAAAAQPSPERMKLANELLVANGEASSFDSIIPTIIEQAAGSFVQANPDLIRDLRDVAKTLVPEFETRKSEITAILARTYAAQFSEAELGELLAFYRSPTGRKLVEQRQELLDEGLKGIQAWSAKFAQEVEGRVRAEMKKRGFTI
ncbi:DUF2059 domain-containing protein [Ancylobacter defluvii]|uniref:DUF2059 domain-containing protein n=1 Tax=Ancylobacter defluvii TaxID=1282440 RepID=A0A9W6NCS7_9HYPH|nr:DUF2059 domain-containing protein [Ancylobacter defluvii]GLK85962.1 hypothetical protein GCM10017653_40320 [Ancylobacter defluvii]